MTTLLSDHPRKASPRDPANRGQAVGTTVGLRAKQSGTLKWLLAGLVVVLGLVAWRPLTGKVTTGLSGGATTAVVEARTFNVVLKEKGELKAAKSTDIKSEVEGRSTIISLIPEGTPVQQGDLLVVLASDQIENRIREEELKESNAITAFEAAKAELDIQRDKNASDIRKAQLQIELKRLELDKYEKGDWEQRLKDAQIAIDQAEISLDRREQDFKASKELYAKNYTTQTEYEEAEFNFKKAGWELEKAKMALDVLNRYTHVADLKQRQSDVEEAIKEADRVGKNASAEEIKKLRNVEGKEKELALIQDQLAKLRTQKEKCRIVAPTQGFVVYYQGGGGRWGMSNDQQIKEGAEVFERQVLLQLPDTSSMMVVVRVHEAKTDKLRTDQPVAVSIEGLPGRTFSGHVRKIAALADSQSGWLNPDLKEYETEILLDPTDVPLKPGVTAHAEILVESVQDRLAVPVQAIYAKAGKRYLFASDSGEVRPVVVDVGAIGAEWAEITSGVESGRRVLLAFGDEYRRLIPDAGPTGESNEAQGRRGTPGGRRPGGRGDSADRASNTKPGNEPQPSGTKPSDVKPNSKEPEKVDSSAAESTADKKDQPTEGGRSTVGKAP